MALAASDFVVMTFTTDVAGFGEDRDDEDDTVDGDPTATVALATIDPTLAVAVALILGLTVESDAVEDAFDDAVLEELVEAVETIEDLVDTVEAFEDVVDAGLAGMSVLGFDLDLTTRAVVWAGGGGGADTTGAMGMRAMGAGGGKKMTGGVRRVSPGGARLGGQMAFGGPREDIVLRYWGVVLLCLGLCRSRLRNQARDGVQRQVEDGDGESPSYRKVSAGRMLGTVAGIVLVELEGSGCRRNNSRYMSFCQSADDFWQ